MKQILILALATLSVSAFALESREYSCKNTQPDLPDNTYSVSHIDVGGGPSKVPFLEIKRYFKGNDGAPEVTEIRGFAAHSKSGTTEFLLLGQLRLQFDNGELFNCQSQE